MSEGVDGLRKKIIQAGGKSTRPDALTREEVLMIRLLQQMTARDDDLEFLSALEGLPTLNDSAPGPSRGLPEA